MDTKWRTVRCESCRGYGMVSDFRSGDFEGAMECPDCSGGVVFLRPSGHAFAYPGGPALGKLYGVTDYERGRPVEVGDSDDPR